MLTYDLDRRGKLARYDYLYRCIREDILAGRLTAGEKLPSKRSLASHLQTAVITVQNAYAQLEAEGYLTRARSAATTSPTWSGTPPRPGAPRPEARRSRSARGCSISAPAAAGRRTFPFPCGQSSCAAC